jgi:hypothetical protein
LQSSVTFTAQAGVTYRIAVDGYNGAVGSVTVNVFQPNCANALLVRMSDTNVTPLNAVPAIARCVRWLNEGSSNHSVVETIGLANGPSALFNSGPLAPGQHFTAWTFAAGIFPYDSTVAGDPNSLAGNVVVPMVASAASASAATPVQIRWAMTSFNGTVYDVQYRFTPSGGSPGAWAAFRTDTATAIASFTASAHNGAGRYEFRARVQNVASTRVSIWSPTLVFTAT